MFAPKKILVPTDFSEFSDNALTEAIDIASQHDSTIYLLHVVGVVQQCSVDYCLPPDMVEDVRRETIRFAQEMIMKQVEKTANPGKVRIMTDVREASSAFDEILREQKSTDVDLIVIASHGKTGMLSHLFGSVADKVTKGASCPVYVVKRPK
jgi:universal stress protein A